jgi:hypothetical protein
MHISKKKTVYLDIIHHFKTITMNETKYGTCAVNVVRIILKDPNNLSESKITDIWFKEIQKLTSSKDSINKCCPRKTLIGLILNNHTVIKSEGNFSFQSKNYNYVQFILLNQSHLLQGRDKIQLWSLILGKFEKPPKKQNGQLDVLLALYNKNLLKF